nr:ABC transporter ATP-binding protein [Acholeplasmatales bacterium]
MITIKNLNKTFSNKNNSINVIKDTSLNLPDTGLITLLGESGSGKTTLLNVIGGLDKFDSGEISYNDQSFKKYNMQKIDEYRNSHISYIFQNYYLLNKLSVYENLRLALEIINITDEEEVNKRIKEALNAVKMFKYRKKTVDTLSGGQQQRIAIARALIKKNKLIIADEPTGNLDSENSINIMNILKEISKTNLVLLVTHNKDLANYYSDYIYNISDGAIISKTNPIKTNLTNNENNIFLHDLDKQELNNDKTNINIYNSNEDVKIDLIYLNGTY